MPTAVPLKTVFVTVGTTLFDALIEAVTTPTALQWMVDHGYTHLVVQHGKGQAPRKDLLEHDSGVDHGSSNNSTQPLITAYDFKPSLADDLRAADLILSHAGAGTIMECLGLHKQRFVCVVNTMLMDNHQAELAYAIEKRGHLLAAADPASIPWDRIETFEPKLYQGVNEHDVPQILDTFFGFRTD